MTRRYYLILSLFFLLFGSSCFSTIPEDIEWNTKKHQSSVITSSSNHLAFPDLIHYGNSWYIAYRESDVHGISSNFSKIKVVRSTDFLNWVECNSFSIEGYDLRDPKFSYNEKTDSIYLHFFAVSNGVFENQEYKLKRMNFFTVFDIEQKKFNDVFLNILPLPKDKVDNWLWRPLWDNGQLYVAGYDNNRVTFFKYKKFTKSPVIFSSLDNGSEVTLCFYNSNLYALVRRNEEALFGIANLDNDSISRLVNDTNIPFQWQSLNNLREFGGPNMIIISGIAYIAGRVLVKTGIQRTAVYKYNLLDKSLNLLVYLESYYDNSYPGMVLLGNKLYGVYYTTSAQGNINEVRTFTITL